jgi:hypothetical protein
MSIAAAIYESTPVGATNSIPATSIMTPGEEPRSYLEKFVAVVVAELEDLEAQGKIRITNPHLESKSGQHFVDLVFFRRLQ